MTQKISLRSRLVAMGTSLVAATLVLTACAASAPEGGVTETATPEAAESVTIELTRHGQTWFNKLDRVQGWADSPLTAEGQAIATKLGEGLAEKGEEFDAAYSADMTRHYDTASLILEGMGSDLDITRVRDLREMSFGAFEGDSNGAILEALQAYTGEPVLTEEQSAGKHPKLTGSYIIPLVNPDPSMPAETPDQVSERALAALEKIAEDEGAKGNDKVLVVSSGLTIMCVLDALGEIVADDIKNASITTLVYKDGTWTVEGMNDVSLIE